MIKKLLIGMSVLLSTVFIAILVLYYTTPVMDWALISKSIPRLCNTYLKDKTDDSFNKLCQNSSSNSESTPITPSTPTPTTQEPTAVTQVDPTADWKTFKSTLLNLSFKYPPESSYSEKNILADNLGKLATGSELSGLQIYFSDNNNKYPSFDATSKDFKAVDSVPHDLITGSMDSKTSFTVSSFSHEIVSEVGTGMYYFTGYSNMECSPGTSAILFVNPPQGSNLKYISFYLGANNKADFSKNRPSSDPCEVNENVINDAVKELADGKIVAVKDKLDKAIQIASTFTTK